MRTPMGFLLLMNSSNTFEKPPLSIKEQLKLLSSRGLIIKDKQAAQHYLKFISYYRFCGYGIEFEATPINEEKCYRQGTTFEQILDCYVFDRKLRLLVIDAIERIEIAVRTVIINELALVHGAHWYLDGMLFLKRFKHSELLQAIEKETLYRAQDGSIQHKKRERFIQHYFDKYSHPKLPAVWMVAEVLSLGTWSIIFANLIDREDQKIICRHFGISYVVMTSWLHSLTYLRNLCAHHSKLWNRSFTLRPLVANDYRHQLENNSRFAAQAAILKIFLDIISPDNGWASHLRALIKQHPMIDVKRLGFSENWESDSFWGWHSIIS
jgi:abortive infection bacteriophage resistance protein